MRRGVSAAEAAGGRLDPPMLVVLDEAANICRIADLPALYSHLGSRGIVPLTILQSYRQGVAVWGETGMAALWGAATVKLIGPGMDDADFAEDPVYTGPRAAEVAAAAAAAQGQITAAASSSRSWVWVAM